MHSVQSVTHGGDVARFDRLFAEHMDAILAYALARVDPESAKDAAAETFLVAWRRLEDVPDPPRAWLLGVTRRTLAGQRRSKRRQGQLVERLVAFGEVEHYRSRNVSQTTEQPVALRALARLRRRDRDLLCLIAWDGLTNREAAELLKCSPGTLAVRLHRARTRLEVAIVAEERALQGGRESKGSSAATRYATNDQEVHDDDF
jgi:RNA polymerase sigma-70 factor (ECF subfamily)